MQNHNSHHLRTAMADPDDKHATESELGLLRDVLRLLPTGAHERAIVTVPLAGLAPDS